MLLKGRYPKAEQLLAPAVVFLHILMDRSILLLLKGVSHSLLTLLQCAQDF